MLSQAPGTFISPLIQPCENVSTDGIKLYTQVFKNRLLCKMLTFIKSLITYIAWLQKVTFLQKRYKSYILYYRVHNQGNRAFFRDQKTSSTAGLGRVWSSHSPPTTPPSTLGQSLELGGGGGLGDVAQSVPRACSGSLGHLKSSQSFAPGHQVQPRGRGLGSEVGRERLGSIHALGLPATESWGPRRNGRQHLRSGWGRKKRPESRQFPPSAPRRGPSADRPAPGRKLGLYLQLITPRPTLPPPSWRQRTTGGACTTPPLLELTRVGRAPFTTPKLRTERQFYLVGPARPFWHLWPLREGNRNVRLRLERTQGWKLVPSFI